MIALKCSGRFAGQFGQWDVFVLLGIEPEVAAVAVMVNFGPLCLNSVIANSMMLLTLHSRIVQ